MRTPLLPFALLLGHTALHAQLLAGEVPAGAMAYEVNIDLALGTAFTADSADIEFDCDDFMDAWAILYRGAPEVDAPHVAMIDFVDDNVEVCMDLTGGFQQRPKYHAFGESLACGGGFEWLFADQLVLGDLGGFTAIGPWSIDSMYIAYRQGGNAGWMLLSFDLTGPVVQLQIHQLLSLCQIPLSVANEVGTAPLLLHPNPANGSTIRVESTEALRLLEVLDASGRTLARYPGNTRTIDAPEAAGSYLVRATHADGRRSVARLLRP